MGEKVAPERVVGQNAQMQHVGIGEDQPGLIADTAADFGSGVSVVDGAVQLWDFGVLVGQSCSQVLHFLGLVLGQGLGGEKQQSPAGGVEQMFLQNGKLVTEALATGHAGADDKVFPV